VEDKEEHRLIVLLLALRSNLRLILEEEEERQSQTAQVIAASPLSPLRLSSFVIDFRTVILKFAVCGAALQHLQQWRLLLSLSSTIQMEEEEVEGILMLTEHQACFQRYRFYLSHHLLFSQH
jgi:hypothetical protein